MKPNSDVVLLCLMIGIFMPGNVGLAAEPRANGSSSLAQLGTCEDDCISRCPTHRGAFGTPERDRHCVLRCFTEGRGEPPRRGEAERRKKKAAAAAAEKEKAAAAAVAAFFAATAAAIENEKKAARKEPPRPSIIVAPLTPGSATSSLLSDPESAAEVYEARKKGYEARKADVLSRFKEANRRRAPCQSDKAEEKAACSTDGKAFDPEEAIRRRNHQYFVWGELSYYIRYDDFRDVYGLNLSKEERLLKILGLAAVKSWPWGTEMGYIIAKDIFEYGSTPPGGGGNAKKGLQKAFNDNQGFKP